MPISTCNEPKKKLVNGLYATSLMLMKFPNVDFKVENWNWFLMFDLVCKPVGVPVQSELVVGHR